MSCNRSTMLEEAQRFFEELLGYVVGPAFAAIGRVLLDHLGAVRDHFLRLLLALHLHLHLETRFVPLGENESPLVLEHSGDIFDSYHAPLQGDADGFRGRKFFLKRAEQLFRLLAILPERGKDHGKEHKLNNQQSHGTTPFLTMKRSHHERRSLALADSSRPTVSTATSSRTTGPSLRAFRAGTLLPIVSLLLLPLSSIGLFS